MPELPDVAGFKRYLDATALHQCITHTSVPDRRVLDGVTPQALGRHLKGTELEQTRRHGKFLFAQADGRGWLVLHFGMSGELRYFHNEARRPPYTAVELEFDKGAHLVYTSRRILGRVGFTEEPDRLIEESSLGPDALSETLTGQEFVKAIKERRGMIKPLLMNQSFIAGIGNIWADEVLFQARLHPKTKCTEISRQKAARLFRVMRRVLRRGASRAGLLRKLPKSYLLTHRDGDHRCPNCDGELATATVAGRTSRFCPRCQGTR
jgi:formamidopyrimidine-DNA glycosylase